MHSPRKQWLAARLLELAFVRCWMRLSAGERNHLLDELRRPFRRVWYLVDEQGVRTLLPEE